MGAEDFDVITLDGAKPSQARGAQGRPVLLSRALYRVRIISLASVRSADRAAALELQLAAWAPFDVSAYRVAIRGDDAIAFSWDDQWVSARMAQAGWEPSRPIIPESLYRSPGADGLRLVQCLDGVEAQVWLAGTPTGSQWWAANPDLPALVHFRRQWGLGAADSAAASPAGGGWLRRPWLSVSPPEGLARQQGAWLRRVMLAGACLLCLWGGMEARAWYEARGAVEALQRELTELREGSAPAVATRNAALEAAAQANRLSAALTGHLPLTVLEQLTAGLPAQGVRVQELTLEVRRLRASLTLAPDVPRAAVVKQLQATGFFSEVSEGPGASGSVVVFEMTLPALGPASGSVAGPGTPKPAVARREATP